jgi:hypothetical protein
MKTLKFLPLFLVFLFVSCDAVRVNSDYDKAVNFSNYKTYAFYKTGIDKVEISDLDKKRILNSIDATMIAKGFTKSETPDILININTKAVKNVNVNNYGYGVGYGWNPYFGYNIPITSNTEGTLTIDFIDAAKKELIWQGEGVGYLTQNTNKKDENIKTFVTKILEQYPPVKK